MGEIIVTSAAAASSQFLGAWATDTDYVRSNEVSNDGDLFVCSIGHTSAAATEPGTGASWETVWARKVDTVSQAIRDGLENTDGTPSSGNPFVLEDNAVLPTADQKASFPEGADATNQLVLESGSIAAIRTNEVIKTATGSLSVVECSGTIITNYGQGAETTLTLPTAAAGLSFLLQIITTGNAIHVKAGANDKIYLDGTALDDADKVSLATPAAANCAAFWTWLTGDGVYDWFCNPINGYWADGGA